MCIKIIHSGDEQEFNQFEPLEQQTIGAKEVLVNYDPVDPKIDQFVDEMERFCKTGISCEFDIKVNPNNNLDGFKLRRKLQKIKYQLDVNEAIKKLTTIHAETDKKILEIAEMCMLGETNE